MERIFGVPGEENLDVVESLRRSRIQLALTRHEQSAAFMAATYGRLTGRAGVCISTLGPGALNLVTGAAYADLGAMPMVMITGQSDYDQPAERTSETRLKNNIIGKCCLMFVRASLVPRLSHYVAC